MIHPSSRQRGFTIIEVLIVLAIAGLILLIVLLVVPSAQRAQRNKERREVVGLIYSEVLQYVVNKNKFPDEAMEFCEFYESSSIKSTSPDAPACLAAFDSDDGCVLVSGDIYTLCYHGRFSSHNYMGPYDQINIQHGHWCSQSTDDPHGYPITDGGTGDSLLSRYAVWTPLEYTGVACTGSV